MAKSKDKELVQADDNALINPEVAGLFDLRENMQGVRPDFPTIKILHQAQLFEMPSGEKVPEFEGIIIDASMANSWWEISYDEAGGGNIPDCFSLDGVVPSHDSDNKQSDDCASCPQNQFGSDGRGKACKNMKRVFIIMDGETFPYRLTVPPSNLKGIDKYITFLSSKGVPYQLARTKFTLNEDKNQDGIVFSQVIYSLVSKIETIEEAKRIKDLVTDLRSSMRGAVVDSTQV